MVTSRSISEANLVGTCPRLSNTTASRRPTWLGSRAEPHQDLTWPRWASGPCSWLPATSPSLCEVPLCLLFVLVFFLT